MTITADGADSNGAGRGLSRRGILKLGASLGLVHLAQAYVPGFVREVLAGEKELGYATWQDIYRNEWTWDAVTWGSHTNQCAPGGCSFRVYSKNGIVWREEQSARSYESNSNYPDYNPQGCQKGCSFHNVLTTPERVKYPLKRVGERGEGRWRRISWDEAYTEIADALLDAHESHGTESFIIDAPHIHAGNVALSGSMRLSYHLNALTPDLNVGIGDDLKGIGQTFGKMNIGYTADNFFDAEMIVLTHSNFSYTYPSSFHFVTEARYNGSEIVLIAPDANATITAADIHLPVKVATDAALWLSVCQVIVAEQLQQDQFIREQTDLALLVRADNGRYLRAADVDGGDEDQLYFFDLKSSALAKAPKRELNFSGVQALEGVFEVVLKSGKTVQVSPAFALLKQKLDREYTPEQASPVCGIHPDVIRTFARKVATKRTCCYIGFTSGKHYHGDLMERSLLLAMALSGNWGKPGTGFNCFLIPDVGLFLSGALEHPVDEWGIERLGFTRMLSSKIEQLRNPDISDEEASIRLDVKSAQVVGNVPPAFFFYNHAGYDELWDNPDWKDPSNPRTFGDYLRESVEKKYYSKGQAKPTPEQTPQVMMLMAHNPLRRQRSGRRTYVEKLFPKLKMLFAIEPRMSSSAAFCDIVLPAAWYYEKDDMTMTFALNPYTALIEKAVQPPGEAKPEWEIFTGLLAKISERAKARGMTGFVDRTGKQRNYADLVDRFTMGGEVNTQLDMLKEMVKAAVAIGTFPEGFTYEKFRELGQVRVTGLGRGSMAHAAAVDVDPTKPLYSLAWHVDRKITYPTFARRAQFYIDHEWFIEAGEALPTHKETPPIGGVYPFRLVMGHSRGTVHSLENATPQLMRLHRGEPVVFLNDQAAAERGIADGDRVRIFNDYDSAVLMVSTSPAVGPDQAVIYMWEPFQFEDWKSHDAMLIGLPKSIQMAGDYGQLRFHVTAGSASPSSDRGLRVDIARA